MKTLPTPSRVGKTWNHTSVLAGAARRGPDDKNFLPDTLHVGKPWSTVQSLRGVLPSFTLRGKNEEKRVEGLGPKPGRVM